MAAEQGHHRMLEDREEDAGGETSVKAVISYSNDVEAAWLRKGKRAFYGYKVHAATESRDGFILGGHVTPANRSDTGEFECLVLEADVPTKGYASKANRDPLIGLRLKDGIMHKAARNRALTDMERLDNRLVSKVRAIVERSFGTLKRLYGFARSRYVGRAKVELEFNLNAMAFNLKKGLRLWAW
jgi:IS5 family transposase